MAGDAVKIRSSDAVIDKMLNAAECQVSVDNPLIPAVAHLNLKTGQVQKNRQLLAETQPVVDSIDKNLPLLKESAEKTNLIALFEELKKKLIKYGVKKEDVDGVLFELIQNKAQELPAACQMVEKASNPQDTVKSQSIQNILKKYRDGVTRLESEIKIVFDQGTKLQGELFRIVDKIMGNITPGQAAQLAAMLKEPSQLRR